MDAREQATHEAHKHSIRVQQQALEQQGMELDLALKELSGASVAYRIVGGLMIATPVETLREEISRKKETLAARQTMLARQLERETHGRDH